MHGQCCLKMLELLLDLKDIPLHSIDFGLLEFENEVWENREKEIQELLNQVGLYIIQNPDSTIVEQIKRAIHSLIFESGYNISMIRNSDYLVEKTGYSYQRLAKLFFQSEQLTIEKYIIKEKIDRVKQLITDSELSLSEIAYMLGYSSVHYLSTQFKSITGFTLSEYKNQFGLNDKAG